MRTYKSEPVSGGLIYAELFGHSKEGLPSEPYYASGSKYTEIDTGKVYLFDELTMRWYLQPEK